VVEAVTGALPRGSHLAETAADHGLVDAVVTPDGAEEWLRRLLDARTAGTVSAGASAEVTAAGTGWDQVLASRSSIRPSGRALLDQLLSRAVALAAPRGDRTVACSVGRLDGRAVVAVALAAQRSGHPTPDGFRLLIRAAELAGRWRLPLLTLVDTPGAEPSAASENDALARTIADAFDAVLRCPSPTVGVLTGEGGSGGALAALVCDTVLATPDSYFAALVPEGAAAALRSSPAAAAETLGVGPALLVGQGVVDRLVPVAGTPGFSGALASALDGLGAQPDRMAARTARWSGPATLR
jgi:acetyl-CoA carboxylase carboxyl transferase subunit beta